MGRSPIMKRYHVKRTGISMSRLLLDRIDECRKGSEQSRSEFIRQCVERFVFSDQTYAVYMAKQAEMTLAYWKYEIAKASGKDCIKGLSQQELRDYAEELKK